MRRVQGCRWVRSMKSMKSMISHPQLFCALCPQLTHLLFYLHTLPILFRKKKDLRMADHRLHRLHRPKRQSITFFRWSPIFADLPKITPPWPVSGLLKLCGRRIARAPLAGFWQLRARLPPPAPSQPGGGGRLGCSQATSTPLPTPPLWWGCGGSARWSHPAGPRRLALIEGELRVLSRTCGGQGPGRTTCLGMLPVSSFAGQACQRLPPGWSCCPEGLPTPA
jgi:hypothetical protein